MMWWSNGWWGWVLVVGAGMVLCMAMMARMMRHGTWGRMWPSGDRDEDTPERILARRLAGGEIDVQEFERLREALERSSRSTADAAEPSHAERRSPAA
jgi:uncharacterized membrane protein